MANLFDEVGKLFLGEPRGHNKNNFWTASKPLTVVKTTASRLFIARKHFCPVQNAHILAGSRSQSYKD
jgi:hypothetical protein